MTQALSLACLSGTPLGVKLQAHRCPSRKKERQQINTLLARSEGTSEYKRCLLSPKKPTRTLNCTAGARDGIQPRRGPRKLDAVAIRRLNTGESYRVDPMLALAGGAALSPTVFSDS